MLLSTKNDAYLVKKNELRFENSSDLPNAIKVIIY